MDIEQVSVRYQITLKAVESLRESLDLFVWYEQELRREPTYDIEREYRVHRDSVIKRYEYTLDTFWKYLKFYLEAQTGVVQNSPKPVFRECQRNNIISEEEAIVTMEMVNARNLTSHMYREEIAEDLVAKIPHYYDLTCSVMQRVQPSSLKDN